MSALFTTPRQVRVPIVGIALLTLLGCASNNTCVFGASAPCACSDGRSGAQFCTAAGTFASCVCTSGTDAGASDATMPADAGAEDRPVTDAGASDTGSIDIGVPVGTPTFAATNGLAIRIDQPGGCGWGYQINGDDGSAYIYCHLSNPTTPSGTGVHAGDLLGYSGGATGAAGAGNSTGAHLHFGIQARPDLLSESLPFEIDRYTLQGTVSPDSVAPNFVIAGPSRRERRSLPLMNSVITVTPGLSAGRRG